MLWLKITCPLINISQISLLTTVSYLSPQVTYKVKQKMMISILLCSFLLTGSLFVSADVTETEADDLLEDVAYYEDGNVIHGDGVTFVDDKPEIDIVSISCDCTTEAFIVTLTVKDDFPSGWAEGYEYSLTVFTSSVYGAITIHYETDYRMTSPGGWASNNAYPEFTVTENSLIATIDDMIIDESTINSFEAFAKLDTTDGALYIDWLPDPDDPDSGDDTDDTSESDPVDDSDDSSNSDDQPVGDGTNDDALDESFSEDTETEVPTDSPGFELLFLLVALIGIIGFKRFKGKKN